MVSRAEVERQHLHTLINRTGKRDAVGVQPLEIEQYLKKLKQDRNYKNPTLDKTRRVAAA
jgi:hypothetical protein